MQFKDLKKTIRELEDKFYPIWHCIEERDYERWKELKDRVKEIKELITKIDPDKAKIVDLLDKSVEQRNWCEAYYWAAKIMSMTLGY